MSKTKSSRLSKNLDEIIPFEINTRKLIHVHVNRYLYTYTTIFTYFLFFIIKHDRECYYRARLLYYRARLLCQKQSHLAYHKNLDEIITFEIDTRKYKNGASVSGG